MKGHDSIKSFEGVPIFTRQWNDSGPCVLLLHGSGPGASSLLNWAPLIPFLAEAGFTVVAADLVGFGHSGMKPQPPGFDIPLWRRQVGFLIDELAAHHGTLSVIAHSFSVSFALCAAAADARITKVVASASATRPLKVTPYLDRSWTTPANPKQLRETLECGVFDRSLVTDEGVSTRWELMSKPGYQDYFRSMFAGNRQSYLDQLVVEEHTLKAVEQPLLIIHGKNDEIVPYEASALPLAKLIRHSDLCLLDHCAHAPAAERPPVVRALVGAFLG